MTHNSEIMAHILGVGIATLDIINYLDQYPAEDSEVRASAQKISRGGNVSNSLAILRQLGEQCDWCGVLADDSGSQIIRQALARDEIALCHCQIESSGTTPTSYIILNRLNGSRTIVHYRDLPELSFNHFAQCDLTRYQWVHFEGRAIDQTVQMLQHLKQQQPQLPCSLEIEKPREGIEALFPYAELLLFSRHYAEASGHKSATSLLKAVQPLAPRAQLVCAWGGDGAYAIEPKGKVFHAPAFAQSHIIDSLGAGDTFNAGMIHNCLAGHSLAVALHNSNRLAGLKCSQQGYTGLAARYQQLDG